MTSRQRVRCACANAPSVLPSTSLLPISPLDSPCLAGGRVSLTLRR